MLRRMSQDRESQQEMTTLLQEFEAWLKEALEEMYEHDAQGALGAAQRKLEELKAKHNVV